MGFSFLPQHKHLWLLCLFLLACSMCCCVLIGCSSSGFCCFIRMCCVAAAAAAAAAAAWTVDAAAVWAAVRGGWCSLFGGSEVPSCCFCSSGFAVAAADVSERSASLGGAHVFFIPPTGPWLLLISLPLARGVFSEPEKSSTLDSSSLKTLVLIKLFSTEKLRRTFFSTFKWLCLIYIQLTLFS